MLECFPPFLFGVRGVGTLSSIIFTSLRVSSSLFSRKFQVNPLLEFKFTYTDLSLSYSSRRYPESQSRLK